MMKLYQNNLSTFFIQLNFFNGPENLELILLKSNNYVYLKFEF